MFKNRRRKRSNMTEEDNAVQKIQEAETDEEAAEIELSLLEQSDNGPQETDPS